MAAERKARLKGPVARGLEVVRWIASQGDFVTVSGLMLLEPERSWQTPMRITVFRSTDFGGRIHCLNANTQAMLVSTIMLPKNMLDGCDLENLSLHVGMRLRIPTVVENVFPYVQ